MTYSGFWCREYTQTHLFLDCSEFYKLQDTNRETLQCYQNSGENEYIKTNYLNRNTALKHL